MNTPSAGGRDVRGVPYHADSTLRALFKVFFFRHRAAHFSLFVSPFSASWLPDHAMEEPAEDLVLALQGENADDLSRLASLQKIEGLLDEAAGPDAEHLCALLRAAGLVDSLVQIVSLESQHAALQQSALLIIGNMCSDEVDSNAALTKAELKACHGFEELLSHLFSPDPIVQAYALGAVQNTCRESDYLGVLWTLDLLPRIEELAVSTEPHVMQFANGAPPRLDIR